MGTASRTERIGAEATVGRRHGGEVGGRGGADGGLGGDRGGSGGSIGGRAGGEGLHDSNSGDTRVAKRKTRSLRLRPRTKRTAPDASAVTWAYCQLKSSEM